VYIKSLNWWSFGSSRRCVNLSPDGDRMSFIAKVGGDGNKQRFPRTLARLASGRPVPNPLRPYQPFTDEHSHLQSMFNSVQEGAKILI
jgi:hypothetical protein